jgi:hypothetical protein
LVRAQQAMELLWKETLHSENWFENLIRKK